DLQQLVEIALQRVDAIIQIRYADAPSTSRNIATKNLALDCVTRILRFAELQAGLAELRCHLVETTATLANAELRIQILQLEFLEAHLGISKLLLVDLDLLVDELAR